MELTDYKAANIKKYSSGIQRVKFKKHPSKIVGIEEFRRICHKIINKGDILLDNGGGPGICADIIREEGITQNIYALDLSPVILKERDPRDICTVGDMEELPYQNDFFDRVLFIAALHHVAKTSQALREAHRVLKKNGHVVLMEPISIKLLLTGKGIRPTPDGVEFSFSLPYIFKNLRESGFKIEYVYYNGFIKRFVKKIGLKPFRFASAAEEIINKIPVVRAILGMFSNYVTIVAIKD